MIQPNARLNLNLLTELFPGVRVADTRAPNITGGPIYMPTEFKISTLFQKNNHSRDQIIADLTRNPRLNSDYQRLTVDLKNRLVDFLSGTKTLPLTYDPFFKKMFNPDVHPERLEGFISSIIGRKVKIRGVLSQEESLLQGTSLLIMDMIVELEDGSVANVEIQKISYLFPGQRMSCYSADLLLRQYARVKGQKGAGFTYNDLKKVYTIIIFENSPAELKKDYLKDSYVHFGSTRFDSGIAIDLLQDYYLISLDVFTKSYYSKEKKQINNLNGWLALLSTDRVDRLDELVSDYPQMESICRDMASYLDQPEEVIGMFSDALRILDENTVHYMMDEMQKQIDENTRQLDESLKELRESREQLDDTNRQLDDANRQLNDTSRQLDDANKEIARLKELLAAK